MTKSEVLQKLAAELELTGAQTEQLFDLLIDELTSLLQNETGFTLPGLGSFSTTTRAAYNSYNPHYEKMMQVPKKRVVRFTQSSVLKTHINGSENE